MIARKDLRLLFIREGKLAAALWHWLDEEPPDAVRVLLLALVEAVGPEYAQLSEDDRDSLIALFFSAARRARAAEPPGSPQLEASTPDAMRSRVEVVRSAARRDAAERDSPWGEPIADCLTIVETFCADPGEGISAPDAAVLYKEVGRLGGPLWITGAETDVPKLALVSARALDVAVGSLVRAEPRFDETHWEYRERPQAEVLEELNRELLETMRAARSVYFADRPAVGRLPSDSSARHAEEQRRATERAATVARASAAIDTIVSPLLDAIGRYTTARAAEAAALEEAEQAERVRARAAAGFPRPKPQRYGVSARGADLWVAEALRWLGEHDAEATPQSVDEGMDVVSSRLAVSVVHDSGQVSVEAVRATFGVATANRRKAVLWTSCGLSDQARQFADLAPVSVVEFDVETSTWAGVNSAGHDFLRQFDSRQTSDEEFDVRV